MTESVINAWNFIDVTRLSEVMTDLLAQSGFAGIRVDRVDFSHINTDGEAVFNIDGEDTGCNLLVTTRVFVTFAANGDFVVSF